MTLYDPRQLSPREVSGVSNSQAGNNTLKLSLHNVNTISQGCAGAPNALKSDLKKPRICPILGQSDPL